LTPRRFTSTGLAKPPCEQAFPIAACWINISVRVIGVGTHAVLQRAATSAFRGWADHGEAAW